MATYGNFTEDQLVTGLKDLKGQGKTDAEIFGIANQSGLTNSQAVDIYNKAGMGGGLLQSAGYMNKGLADWLKSNNITEEQYRTAAGQAGISAQGQQDLMANQGPYKVNVSAGQYANPTGAITQDSVNYYQSLFNNDKVLGQNVVAKLNDGSTFQRTANGRGLITRADGTTIDVGPETDLAQLATQNKGVAEYFGIGRPGGAGGTGSGGLLGSAAGSLGGGAGGTGEFSFSSGGAAMRGVRPEDTVKQQLSSLLASDSTYIDQARARALQTANSRGLLNTSLAAGAGAEAAISQGLPIAQQDAATFFKQGLTNQEATNQFSLAAQERAARSQEAELGRQFQARENALSRAESRQQFESTMAMNNDRFQQQFGLDKAKFDLDSSVALQNLSDSKMNNYRSGVMNILNGTYPDAASRLIALDAFNATYIGDISQDAINRVSASARSSISQLPPSTTKPATPTTPPTTSIPNPGQSVTIDGRTGTIIAGPDGRRYFQDSTGVYEINTGPDVPTPRVPSPTDANRTPI